MSSNEHIAKSHADEFLKALQHLSGLLCSPEGSKNYESLANAYDLSAAKDSIDRFTKSGFTSDFAAAERRLNVLVERAPTETREEAKKALRQFAAIASRLTASELRLITESSERDLPDGNTLSNRTEASDVLVIAAMYDPELAMLLEHIAPFKDFVGTTKSGLPDVTYFVGSITGVGSGKSSAVSVTALFLARTGLTDCASLVASAMRVFKPRLVAMTGVCAGRRSMKVKKNDVIIPASSFTYDSGKYTDVGFEREPHWADASTRVIQRVRSLGGAVLDSVVRQLNTSLPARVRRPALHYDVMASGSSVVDKNGMIDEIAGTNRKVVGLDMESYAFLRSATLTDPTIPRIIVKGVMDYSTGKSDAVKAQAAFWAAAFLSSLIRLDFEQLTGSRNSG